VIARCLALQKKEWIVENVGRLVSQDKVLAFLVEFPSEIEAAPRAAQSQTRLR
jgi:hypothetical protein